MTCSDARSAISAQLDGELSADEGRWLDTHLGSCMSCASYQNDAFELRRALRLQPVSAPAEPRAFNLAGSLRTVSMLRWALFVIGATLVILNASSIVMPGSGASAHLDRHDGVFGTALGIGMLAIALKPYRAIGLVPITSTIAVLMTIVAIADLISGNANLLAEAMHVLQLAGLICLWVISGGPSRVPKHLASLSQLLPRSVRVGS